MHERPSYNEETNTIDPFSIYCSNRTESTSDVAPKNRSKDFENLSKETHDRLHMVLNYVVEVKEIRKIDAKLKMKKTRKRSNRKLLQESRNKENEIKSTTDLLTSTCTLYSLVNGTSCKSVADYLSSVSLKENKLVNKE